MGLSAPFRAAAILSAVIALGAPALCAQPLEQAVKAAFMPKFAPYVSWPSSSLAPGMPLNICVVGRDPLGSFLNEASAGQQLGQSPIAVRRLTTIERTSGCHMAFLGGSDRQSIDAALASLRGAPVLTVTDARSGSSRGMVHFDLHQGRVRFHIDTVAARASGLTISSRLLNLALTVKAWWAPFELSPQDHG